MSEKLEKLNKALAKNAVSTKPVLKDDIKLNNDAEEDYKIARDNLKNLLNKSDEAMDYMMQVAAESEHPRSFEVLAVMFKTSADMTAQLIDLQKKRHELDKLNNEPTQSGGVTNNNLFVGSTADLQKMLAKGNDEPKPVN